MESQNNNNINSNTENLSTANNRGLRFKLSLIVINFLKWILKTISLIYNGIKSFIINLTKSDKKESPEVKQEPLKQLHSMFESEMANYSTYLHFQAIEKDFNRSVKFMIDSGYKDGVLGIKSVRQREINTIAENRAQRLYSLAETVLKGKWAKLKTDRDAREKFMLQCKATLESLQNNLSDLLNQRHREPRNHNALWGILCIVSGFLLILADIPLSVKVLENGFGFHRKIKSENQELLYTAIGISLCSIFFKIYYDLYIGYKKKTDIKTIWKYNSEKNDEIQINSKNETELLKEEKDLKFKRRVHTGILIFTLLVILILAIFRTQTAIERHQLKNVSWQVYFMIYTSLTIVFPVMSGICLSIGTSIMQNVLQLLLARVSRYFSQKRFFNSLRNYTEIEKEETDLKTELEKWSKDEVRKSYTEILLAYYDRSYKYGAAYPESRSNERDFYSQVAEWRRVAIARKTNNHVIKISEL